MIERKLFIKIKRFEAYKGKEVHIMVAEIKRHGVVVTCFISTRSDLISDGELTPFFGFPLIFIRSAAASSPGCAFAAKLRQRCSAGFRLPLRSPLLARS